MKAGSSSDTTTCVMSETATLSIPPEANSEDSACCSMYPICPWLSASHTSMLIGGI